MTVQVINPSLAKDIVEHIKNHSGCPFSSVEKKFGADPSFHETWWGMVDNNGDTQSGYIVRMDEDKCYLGPNFDLADTPKMF